MNVSKLLEAVFGKVANPDSGSSNKRQCVRCRRRYDMTKVKGEWVAIDPELKPRSSNQRYEEPTFNVALFCSKLCADTKGQTAIHPDSRQQRFRRQYAREWAATNIKFGSGQNAFSWSEGMTRRSARLISRRLARKAMREKRA